jgi:putative membrane protein
MKKLIFPLIAMAALLACNNEGKDSVEKADSINDAKMDTSGNKMKTSETIKTDDATTDFLVRAANGGITEVEAGKVGEQKAINPDVKRFAAMMVQDHSAANEQVKSLASARNVTLPATPSEEKTNKLNSLSQKTGKAFDKEFMDMMVDDHQDAIRLFEKHNDSKDAEVGTFITNTLPKLKMHLDSAQAVRKRLRN